MNTEFRCVASAAFGMEGLVSRELKHLGVRNVAAANGEVRFSASAEELFLCNLQMHFCDRLFIIVSSAPCTSFDSLFHLVYDADWSPFFSGNESIDVSCKCTRSKLMSPRDCQSVTKKAIIEKIRHDRRQQTFSESGPFPSGSCYDPE